MDKKNEKKSFLSFIYSNLHILALLLVVIAIVVLNFHSGKFLITNDNYSPELNPSLTISRSIETPAWRGYRALGVPSDSEQSDLFRASIFWAAEKFLPVWSIAQIYTFICLAIGVISFALLAKRIARDHLPKLSNKVVAFAAGLFYLTTLWTAWIFVFPLMPYIAQFGFLPLVLLACYGYIKKPTATNALLLLLASLLIASSALISTLFIVEFVFILGFMLIIALLEKKNVAKRFLGGVALFLIPQLFWLLPFALYAKNSGNSVIQSYVNRSITDTTIETEMQKMTAANSLRFYTRYLDIKDSNLGEEKLFTAADLYSQNDGYQALSYLPIFFAVIAIIYGIAKKKWIIVSAGFAAFIFWYFIKNLNVPFAFLYEFLQKTFSFFNQAFRWPTSKFGGVYLVALALLSSIGVAYFASFLGSLVKEKSRRFIMLIFVGVVAALQLFYVGYIFQRQLIAERAFTDLPSEYFELADYFNENDPTGRVINFPPPNNSYFRENSWGFVGSGFLQYVIPNPLMDESLAIGSGDDERAVGEINMAYLAANNDGLMDKLMQYDVKYVLIDHSLIKGRYGYELDWNLATDAVGGMNKIWENGSLVLYEVPSSSSSLTEVTTRSGLSSITSGYFEKNLADYPSISPVFSTLANLGMDGNWISGESTYEGTGGSYSADLSNINLNESPATIKLIGDDAYVYPALPEVSNFIYELPYARFANGANYEYLVVGNDVIPTADINDGYTIGIHYGDIASISGVNSASFVKNDYLRILAGENPSDCSGNEGNVVTSAFEGGTLTLISGNGIGCVYEDIKVFSSGSTIARVHLGWNAEPDTMIGYCLWSNLGNRCLNNNRYFYTNTDASSEVFVDIPLAMQSSDSISLSVYVVGQEGKNVSADFNQIELDLTNQLVGLERRGDQPSSASIEGNIENGQVLEVKIPVIHGQSSYSFVPEDGMIWEPSLEDCKIEGGTYEFYSNDEGLHQVSLGCYLSQMASGVSTDSLQHYMWFWSGVNVETMPGFLCLEYINDGRCWDEEFFQQNGSSAGLNDFMSRLVPGSMYFMYQTGSYERTSENVLNGFVVQPIPLAWENFSIESAVKKLYEEYPTELVSQMAIYSIGLEEFTDENSIVTIPQSYSSGWNAYVVPDSLKDLPGLLKYIVYPIAGHKLSDDDRVKVNGWKQGWVVSTALFDSTTSSDNIISVLYLPNLLAYAGLLILAIVFVILLMKIFINRRDHLK